MDVLWSPWRYQYIKGSETATTQTCVFCDLLGDDSRSDREKFILHRAEFNFVILNIFPYISGHLMIVPYAHTADLDALDERTSGELISLAQRTQKILRDVYRPHGYNLGMNLGQAAGAGVATHLHLHFLPRWFGDSNFMTPIGETRVIPEDLNATYDKLAPAFNPQ